MTLDEIWKAVKEAMAASPDEREYRLVSFCRTIQELGEKKGVQMLRRATKLTRFCIENRGCGCNKPDHRCGTNQMLADVAAIEENLP